MKILYSEEQFNEAIDYLAKFSKIENNKLLIATQLINAMKIISLSNDKVYSTLEFSVQKDDSDDDICYVSIFVNPSINKIKTTIITLNLNEQQN